MSVLPGQDNLDSIAIVVELLFVEFSQERLLQDLRYGCLWRTLAYSSQKSASISHLGVRQQSVEQLVDDIYEFFHDRRVVKSDLQECFEYILLCARRTKNGFGHTYFVAGLVAFCLVTISRAFLPEPGLPIMDFSLLDQRGLSSLPACRAPFYN